MGGSNPTPPKARVMVLVGSTALLPSEAIMHNDRIVIFVDNNATEQVSD